MCFEQIQSANVAVTNSAFTSNTNGNSEGGAISSDGGILTIDTSAFVGNTASRGGAIYQAGGRLAVNNTRLSGNRATSSGGSIFTTLTNVNVYNSTFTSNIASEPHHPSLNSIALRAELVTDCNSIGDVFSQCGHRCHPFFRLVKHVAY